MKVVSVKGALFLLGFFLFLVPVLVFAQEPCGNIIERYDDGEGNIIEDVTPVEDCANPFGIEAGNPDLTISFGEILLEDGGIYAWKDVADTFFVENEHPLANDSRLALYRHEGGDYVFIGIDTEVSYTFTEAGTYTIVMSEDQLILTENWFIRLITAVTPIAHAFPGPSRIITFEVIEAIPEPTGISNILFLPGIQASRLYTETDGEEERLWEPGGNDDVARLAMTNDGISVENIYAKDVIDEKLDVAVGGNIYKGFLEFLNGLGTVQLKPTIGIFPYDWRQDIFDVVEQGIRNNDGSYIPTVEAIEFLATTAVTKKVTLIAHSNGGLLAKAIMLKLKEEGKENLVDKIIFIATPHIGTPKGLAALLHGYDQDLGKGFVADDEVVRSVMKNMPGVYGLLPSEAYVTSLTEPMISFDDSSTTALYRSKYGFTISSIDEYVDFLKGVEGRGDAGDLINEISKANPNMLDKALAEHLEKLDSWVAPADMELFNIVGTGLKTAKSIEYKEFVEAPCPTGQCIIQNKIEPVLHFTNYGDQTVVSRSAKEYQDESNLFFDLKSYNAEKTIFFDYIHADIAETETVQNLVDYILHGSSTQGIEFVSETEPTFSANSDIYTIHSPARIYLRDVEGNITGRTVVGGEWRSEIPESDYLEAGGVKYVIVPSDASYEIFIEGEGDGVYTHELKILQGDIELPQYSFTATSTPTMIAQYKKTDGVFSTITVDMNGDGKIDIEMTQDGKIIDEDDEEEEEDDDLCEQLEEAIHNLHLSSRYKNELVELKHKGKHACKDKKEKWHTKKKGEEAFKRILKKINEHKKAKRITESERMKILEIINKLIRQ